VLQLVHDIAISEYVLGFVLQLQRCRVAGDAHDNVDCLVHAGTDGCSFEDESALPTQCDLARSGRRQAALVP
jgi:hypothetical protein